LTIAKVTDIEDFMNELSTIFQAIKGISLVPVIVILLFLSIAIINSIQRAKRSLQNGRKNLPNGGKNKSDP